MQVVAPEPPQSKDQVSPQVYAALVDSLFHNAGSMFFGVACAAAAALMTAIKTGNPLIWPCAVFIVIAGGLRALQMHAHSQIHTPISVLHAQRWERIYAFGSILHAISLGIWCVIVILGNDDPVAHMLCLAVTIGYVAAGAGRNYGRPKVVQWHILLSCGPMSAALVLHGSPYYIALAVLLVMFFLGLKDINLTLNRIFVNALTASEREAALASQFDIALNNMPHGLCMFDATGNLAVMNYRFREMLGLSIDLARSGTGIEDVVQAGVKAQAIQAGDGKAIIEKIQELKKTVVTTVVKDAAGVERALSWTFQPMTDGGVVVLVEDITERRNAAAKINHMARYDELTGLPNRVSFRDEIEEILIAAKRAPLAALLFIDLDQFKQVNDTLGHPTGDRLLCMVADRLRELLPPHTIVARFGGDEFVVFQQHIASKDDAAELARKIVERLSERYEIDHHRVEIGASIGIVITLPTDRSADTLLKNADMALYRAKADGRGTFCFFREDMAQTVEARRTLELDLRHALANDEFELFFQPLVNLKTGRITTCEALLRWTHAERGVVSPGEIIPVAEDMGLIVDLGRWILRKACMECMKWPDNVRVAVNFSPLQFHQRDVLTEVQYALEVSGLPANRLEIEITESALLRKTEWVHDVLVRLAEAGVRISLDDFGTGYSSLSYLHNFPLHKVKIDRSFLEDINSDRPLTLLRGVARLSAELGMLVVVEGIENSKQLDLVTADGTVTEAQGFLFSPPVPATQIRKLLAASHGRRLPDTGPGRHTSRSIA
ncbi:MAG TPA: EAL domain-containing protein [Xanthobacteraceae bacterium]|nr:EAL domain-containing protein [Xanthobacteraceae bacterium]